LQAKLLQVLQNKQVIRLGEGKPRPLNVRIITATNSNLKEQTALKNFREDLYYRINTMEITLPPLREREEDIVPLAQFLLDKMADKYDSGVLAFDTEALKNVTRHAWSGNIRELENRIERAVILCDNNIVTTADLDLDKITFTETNDDGQLSGVERATIEKALQKYNHNISKAAEELGLSRAALYRRMDKYELGKN